MKVRPWVVGTNGLFSVVISVTHLANWKSCLWGMSEQYDLHVQAAKMKTSTDLNSLHR